MTTSKKSQPKRAAEAWRLMFDFLTQSTSQRLESLQKRGLTPNDSKVLFGLDENGKPIGVLARELACDPSTATWLVDRLERLGLTERRSSQEDRRVKLVALTAQGASSREELLKEYHRPPPELGVLSAHELNELIGLLKKLRTVEVHRP
jgi:DNA-binding MarR family transcriptional regulator